MKKFEPHIAATTYIPEFTIRAIILGCLLSLIFGVGNAYLGLKVGTTVSASIPAAVLSMAILRTFFKRATILENNMVQTIATVGEGIAAGLAFTAPALFILGAPPSIFRMFILSVLGGILGVLWMIPMRRYLIVEEHGKLPFPEGIACAAILESGETGRKKALLALVGIGAGILYKVFSSVLNLWKEVATWEMPRFFRTEFSVDCTPALLGVGYIIGPRIASLLFVGGILGWWVLIPLIAEFGTGTVAIFPSTIPLSQMSPEMIWSNYIRYIGAGAVGIGGLISLFKIAPLIGKTLKVSGMELFGKGTSRRHLPRTEQDISLRYLILGSAAIILFLAFFPGLNLNIFTILFLIILGFFFVGVTSITVGLVGSTSSPVSGMTITTLLLTCLFFVAIGWTERIYLISALTMAVVVNVAMSLAGNTSQDLKTGFLLGATPKWQQIGEIIGSVLPALTIGAVLYLLNATYGFGSSKLPAPQGTLMALIAKGVMTGNIPFVLVFIGVVIGFLIYLMQLPVLPVAMGLYLPLSLSTGIMVGGVFSWLVRRKNNQEAIDRGILIASGLIAGDACTGVLIALLSLAGWVSSTPTFLFPDVVSLLIFLLIGVGLTWGSLKKTRTHF